MGYTFEKVQQRGVPMQFGESYEIRRIRDACPAIYETKTFDDWLTPKTGADCGLRQHTGRIMNTSV